MIYILEHLNSTVVPPNSRLIGSRKNSRVRQINSRTVINRSDKSPYKVKIPKIEFFNF